MISWLLDLLPMLIIGAIVFAIVAVGLVVIISSLSEGDENNKKKIKV